MISKQLWKCISSTAERVWGLGYPDRDARRVQPLIYCEEHARLCRHEYVGQQAGEYVMYRQGEISLDTAT